LREHADRRGTAAGVGARQRRRVRDRGELALGRGGPLHLADEAELLVRREGPDGRGLLGLCADGLERECPPACVEVLPHPGDDRVENRHRRGLPLPASRMTKPASRPTTATAPPPQNTAGDATMLP